VCNLSHTHAVPSPAYRWIAQYPILIGSDILGLREGESQVWWGCKKIAIQVRAVAQQFCYNIY